MVDGGAFAQLFDLFAEIGVFQYILPFLVIFALVYGVLARTNIFKDNNAVNGIIALAVGLLALQFDMVPIFFSQVFPKLGIGLAVLLVVLIILGLFMPQQKWVVYVLFGIAALTLIVVLAGSFDYSPSAGPYSQYIPLVIAGVILIVIVAVFLAMMSPKPKSKFAEVASPALRDLFGIK
jgi:hypothetical protein